MSFLTKMVQTNARLALPSPAIWLNPTRALVSRVNKVAEIEKRLGLPEKPKRPLLPFIRFSNDMRPSLMDGKRKIPEISSELAKLWRTVDESKKEIYRKAYEKDLAQFRKELNAYESKITAEQAEQLQHELASMKIVEQKRFMTKQRKTISTELGKPKRPPSPFLLFSDELRGKSATKMNIKTLAAKWNALSDDERKAYSEKSSKSMDNYIEKLRKWEEEMVKTGKIALLRANRMQGVSKKENIVTSKPKSKPKKSE